MWRELGLGLCSLLSLGPRMNCDFMVPDGPREEGRRSRGRELQRCGAPDGQQRTLPLGVWVLSDEGVVPTSCTDLCWGVTEPAGETAGPGPG